MKPTLKARCTTTKLVDGGVEVTLDIREPPGTVLRAEHGGPITGIYFKLTIPPEYKPPSAGDELELVVPCGKRRGK